MSGTPHMMHAAVVWPRSRGIQALLFALLALVQIMSPPVQAQGAYPAKTVTIVVPFAPGGALDLTARAFAPVLQKVVGQPVVVANKTGASGAVGAAGVAVAPADGYTLLVTSSFVATLPAVDRLFGRTPAFTRDQFQPVALLVAEPVLLFVNSDQPWRTFRDFADDAKKRDGALVFSSSGIFGSTHLPIEIMLKAAGLRMRHLPMAGGGPAMTAVLGGNAHAVASYPSVGGPQAKAGKLRALANWGGKRHPDFADVPTLKELGLDIEYYTWIGLQFAKGVPEPIVRVMNEAARKAAADPDFKQNMDRIGSGIDYMDRDAFAAFITKDSERLEAIVAMIGKVE